MARADLRSFPRSVAAGARGHWEAVGVLLYFRGAEASKSLSPTASRAASARFARCLFLLRDETATNPSDRSRMRKLSGRCNVGRVSNDRSLVPHSRSFYYPVLWTHLLELLPLSYDRCLARGEAAWIGRNRAAPQDIH